MHFQSSKMSCPLEKGTRFPLSHFGQGGKKKSAVITASRMESAGSNYLRLLFPFHIRNDVASMISPDTKRIAIRSRVR